MFENLNLTLFMKWKFFRCKARINVKKVKNKLQNLKNDMNVAYLISKNHVKNSIKNMKISYYKKKTIKTERKYEKKMNKFSSRFYELGGGLLMGVGGN